jgi:hypothetical protein
MAVRFHDGRAEMSWGDDWPVTVTVGGGPVHASARGESSPEPPRPMPEVGARGRSRWSGEFASDGEGSRDVDGGEVARAATGAPYPMGRV